MNLLNEFVEVMKKLALAAVEDSKPVQVCFGTVKTVDPISVYVDQKLLLSDKQLILTKNVSNFTTNTVTDSTVSVSGSVSTYATSFVGKIPYYYGGGREYRTLEDIVAAGAMCDCSAYTERVFRHFGAEIGTTTYEQQDAGVGVEYSEMIEGDLLLFNNHSSGAQPGHVGIYLGNGQVVHEGGGNYTGNVKIGSLSAFDVMYVRRITIQTPSNYTSFPKYQLSQSAIEDIATCITGETGGDDVTACLQEASQMANLNEVTKGRSNTESAIIKTLHSGWYASSSWTRGCTQVALDAVRTVLIEGKRVLPRYVTEHNTFPLDILNAKSRSSYSKGDSVRNRYGSNYQFYCFFGSDGSGDISGYFQKDYEKYKSDIPWTEGMSTAVPTSSSGDVVIHNGLNEGDSVILLRIQGGQKYVIMDKVML